MNPELINRLKVCLEWLAKEMPDKFQIDEFEFETSNSETLIDFSSLSKDIIIAPDPKCEFSNALGRIMWEGFNVKMFIANHTHNDNSFMYRVFPSHLSVSTRLKIATTELEAQIETVCIYIEGVMKK